MSSPLQMTVNIDQCPHVACSPPSPRAPPQRPDFCLKTPSRKASDAWRSGRCVSGRPPRTPLQETSCDPPSLSWTVRFDLFFFSVRVLDLDGFLQGSPRALTSTSWSCWQCCSLKARSSRPACFRSQRAFGHLSTRVAKPRAGVLQVSKRTFSAWESLAAWPFSTRPSAIGQS